jgi:endonuclease/exonuclease/phosphatase family metal-dependent hydrolase
MTLVVRVMICAVIVAGGVRGVGADLPKEIRVVTYNIHKGEGMDGKTDLLRIAKVLLTERPDMVALQAVDQKTGRSKGVDQAAALGKLTGMKAVFSRAMDFDGGAYGNAVLTKLPVRSEETVKLKLFEQPNPERAEQRALEVVELGEKDGPGLLFLCTSLDYRPGNEERMASAKTINELIRKRGDELAILAGTLNFYPGFDVPREFAKEWKIVGVDAAGVKFLAEGIGKGPRFQATYPADHPTFSANYIMYRPAARWQVAEMRVIEEKVASNHRPVLAVLRRVEKDSAGKDAK